MYVFSKQENSLRAKDNLALQAVCFFERKNINSLLPLKFFQML